MEARSRDIVSLLCTEIFGAEVSEEVTGKKRVPPDASGNICLV